MINAIETHYDGYRFRSRLEARWAVFFNALEIAYEYEREGFNLEVLPDETRRYLPDFWLPATKTWVEVKGEEERLDYELVFECVEYGGQLPDIAHGLGTLRGLLILGPIPTCPQGQSPTHPLIQHHKGVLHSRVIFVEGGLSLIDDGDPCGGPRDLQVNQLVGNQRRIDATPSDAVRAAYKKARGARFEHGEKP